MHLMNLVEEVAQRIKNKLIQRKIQQKARRLEKLRRDVEAEDLHEAERRAALIQLRSNVRRNPSWCLQPVVRKPQRRLYTV